MPMIASIHGRLIADPDPRQTKTGKDMTLARLAVDVTGNQKGDEPETLWVSLMAFGHAASALARAAKGEMLSAMGRLTRGRYIGKDGDERESWTLLADSIITARSARPGQSRKDAPRPSPQGDGMILMGTCSFESIPNPPRFQIDMDTPFQAGLHGLEYNLMHHLSPRMRHEYPPVCPTAIHRRSRSVPTESL